MTLAINRTVGTWFTITTPDGVVIKITVVDGGHNVRLGIDAPRDYIVERPDMHKKTKETLP